MVGGGQANNQSNDIQNRATGTSFWSGTFTDESCRFHFTAVAVSMPAPVVFDIILSVGWGDANVFMCF